MVFTKIKQRGTYSPVRILRVPRLLFSNKAFHAANATFTYLFLKRATWNLKLPNGTLRCKNNY